MDEYREEMQQIAESKRCPINGFKPCIGYSCAAFDTTGYKIECSMIRKNKQLNVRVDKYSGSPFTE